ncbi:hypothetical protein HNP46_002963 [Pseudomonas nitritireducens]|uniref:Uncharacterized protein n=1 Tax=Pseudomonas nitroreducens TaxID=46680 RepID=A0A7W7KKP1_PSENT|nr:hypothetical protein [Pseudomonas nitritireducens]MBB4864099.1 hypothetical protein [Pseudomonas nitritireducens]
MSGPDALSQCLGTLLLALAFSTFILFVRSYRPARVSGRWYNLALTFIGLWLALWPELGNFLGAPDRDSALGLLAEILATLAGGVAGAALAAVLGRLMREKS